MYPILPHRHKWECPWKFFGKWTELNQFQRTRGVLQTFAAALREAEKWDTSPIIGPQVFLNAPGNDDLSPALQKLAEIAKDSQADKNPQWPTNLKTELPRVVDAQKAHAGTLIGRELEAACVATFIYSQPIGEQDVYLFNDGTHARQYRVLGAHPVSDGIDGTRFAVRAPSAREV